MKPRFIGKASAAFSIEWMCHGPGVQVVAKVPVAGPVPPPSMVVMPLARASSICCGQMKWMCESMPPAVTIIPSPAMISVPGPIDDVDARLHVGVAGLAERGDAAVLDRDVGLDDAPVVDHERVGDDGVGDVCAETRLALAHAVADRLAAAELHFFAVAAGAQGVVVFDLDDQLGVGQAHAVADRGAEHLGIGAARESRHQRAVRRSRSRAKASERPADQAAKAVHDPVAAERDEHDAALLPRLEAHRGARGDVQAHAVRGRAVEAQRRVGLGEVIVRADLDRPVAGVLDDDRARLAARR